MSREALNLEIKIKTKPRGGVAFHNQKLNLNGNPFIQSGPEQGNLSISRPKE